MIVKKPLVLYHGRCVDGSGAAFAAWCKFGEEAEYRAVLHGDSAPSDEEVRDRDVYVLDFAYSYEDSSRIWRSHFLGGGVDEHLFYTIDHHATTPHVFEGTPYPKPPYLIFDVEHSGAVLAWKYFHGDAPVPEILRYIEDKDLWRWKLPYSREVSAALEARGVRTNFRKLQEFVEMPDSVSFWLSHNFQDVLSWRTLIAEGTAVLRAQRQYADAIIDVAQRVQLSIGDGCYIGVWVASAPILQSEVGSALAEAALARGEAPLGIVWYRDGASGLCHVSLRSVGDFDVSAIAKRYGGAGHKNAAGFECVKLPW